MIIRILRIVVPWYISSRATDYLNTQVDEHMRTHPQTAQAYDNITQSIEQYQNTFAHIRIAGSSLLMSIVTWLWIIIGTIAQGRSFFDSTVSTIASIQLLTIALLIRGVSRRVRASLRWARQQIQWYKKLYHKHSNTSTKQINTNNNTTEQTDTSNQPSKPRGPALWILRALWIALILSYPVQIYRAIAG